MTSLQTIMNKDSTSMRHQLVLVKYQYFLEVRDEEDKIYRIHQDLLNDILSFIMS